MIHQYIRALCACTSIALAASAFAGDRLEFAPKTAAMRKKELRVTHYLNLQSMGVSRDQGPLVKDSTAGTVSTWEHVVFLDRVDKLGDGKPFALVRKYDEVAAGGTADLVFTGANKENMVAKQTAAFTSPLVRRDVAFTWVEGEHGWSRMYDKLDGEEAVLAGVDVDADLFEMLPGREVSVGDTWDPPLSRVVALLAPGGKLELVPKQKKPFPRTMKVGVGGDIAELLNDPTGSLHAKYAGKRTVDGAECAVIELELALQTAADRTAQSLLYTPDEELKSPQQLESCKIDLAIAGKGEILWNLAEKRFQNYKLDGTEKLTVSAIKKMLDEGEVKATLTEQSQFDGTLSITLANLAPDPEKKPGAADDKTGEQPATKSDEKKSPDNKGGEKGGEKGGR